MAGKISKNKGIVVETEYNNIVVVNPNQVYDENGIATERLVDHEDLVFYANLETFIIPRTKLAIGESQDSPVMNSTIASVFGGDDDLKINFLKPKGKKYFDTSWSDQLTGDNSRDQQGINQKKEKVVNQNGVASFKNSVIGVEDTQLLGINSINVDITGVGIPEVTMELTDIQGRALFEQGENSLYSAFFNFPYPLFYLTLKGYYGKAIKYRLSLKSFNARFEPKSGSYAITLKLIGKFTAILFDTPLSYAITAPKMFNTEITITDTANNQVKSINTYKGRQKLDEVYEIYKNKGLIDKNFPHLSIEDFINRTQNYVQILNEDLKNKADFTILNDVWDFRQNLDDLEKYVYSDSLTKYLDTSSFYVNDGLIYYPFKKEIDTQKQEDYKSNIDKLIINYVSLLKLNATFGDGGKRQIPVDIKNITNILKPLDIDQWLENDKNVLDTYYYRVGKQLDLNNPNDRILFDKFKVDETINKLRFTFLDNETEEIKNDYSSFFVFGDKRIADGSYQKNSFLDKIDVAKKKLTTNEEEIEGDIAKILADRQLKNPNDGGLGFKPTIRNVFAIIFSGVDAFLRLMEDTHQSAWDVRENPSRLLSVIPPEKSFSPDALKSIQKGNGQLDKDNVIYPWPLYFTKEKQTDGRELYTIQYPGDPKVINQTKGFDYSIWPEVGFVEGYLKGATETAKPVQPSVYNNPSDYNKYVSANAIEFPYQILPYQDLAIVPFLYELFERTYVISNYLNFDKDNILKYQIDKFYGDAEASNISNNASNNIELNQILKNYKFTYSTFINTLKKISNDGEGVSWQTYIRSLFKTEYLSNEIPSSNEVLSIDTFTNTNTNTQELPLSTNLESYLKSTDSSKKLFTDLYPFTDETWLNANTQFNTFDTFNNTINVFTFSDDKKTITRLNKNANSEDVSLISNKEVFNNGGQSYVSYNNIPINEKNALTLYYQDRTDKKFYVTEKKLVYNSSYSGNVGQLQTTSLINTPYFINALINDVNNLKTNNDGSFATLGYLFVNSLPLLNTTDSFKDLNQSIAASFKKYSSIHQVPYAWVLKYGSIWYRYKKYINDGVDILTNVWKDFDYKNAYDPINGLVSAQYEIKTATSTIPFVLKTGTTFATGTYLNMNVGFYPKVIDSVYYYLTKNDLFTGYTKTDFENYYNDGLRVWSNTNARVLLNYNFDTTNPNTSLNKNSYYQFKYVNNNTQNITNNNIILFPSTGGIQIDQSYFECINDDGKQKIPYVDNVSAFNGTCRPLWGSSNFGYFDNTLITKPSPTELILNLNENKSIEDIFALFDPQLLDEFENIFLNFCKYNPKAEELILKKEVTDPTYNNPNKVSSLKYKSLFNQLKNLFVIDKTGLVFTNTESQDGLMLGKKQIETFTSSLNDFLNFDCIIKIGNPGNFDRLLFNSFSTNTDFVPEFDKLTFDPYVRGSLPGDYIGISFATSITQYPEEWKTLQTYVGFSTLDSLKYEGFNSYITDFFIDNNIAFTSDNIIKTYPLIKIYATQKLNDQTLNKTKFETLINDYLTDRKDLQTSVLNETFRYLNVNLKNIQVTTNTTPAAVSGDIVKLSTYNTLKAYNDKWIAGSDFVNNTIFEDFLFMDRANSDIGNDFVLDIEKVTKLLDININPTINMMQIVSKILTDNYFTFFAMPAYVNFYGLQKSQTNAIPKDLDLPNSLFGTHLQVDYLDSLPKFLCLYVGNTSEYPKPKENSFIRFGDDSFDLRVPDNPLSISENTDRDLSKSNKVVGFAVDFGIQNQNMFKDLNLNMSEMQNTSESFKVMSDLGSSSSGDKVAQQSVSLYSVYKSRSYSCEVTSMGNTMIQPTMYFTLRHVPMFYGPYWIYKVNHSVNKTSFTTKFTGSRIPKYSLPKVDNLLSFVNKKINSSYKEKIKKEKTQTQVVKEILLNIDSNVGTLKSPQETCLQLTKYQDKEFVDAFGTKKTLSELIQVIKSKTTDVGLRTLLTGMIISAPSNSYDVTSKVINAVNNNFFTITTNTTWNGNLESYINKQCCVNILQKIATLVSFDNVEDSINFIISYYTPQIPVLNNLLSLNNGDNETKYSNACSQLYETTWYTLDAISNGWSAQQIKQNVTNNYQNHYSNHDELIEIFRLAYNEVK
jgi:hypothetical protein